MTGLPVLAMGREVCGDLEAATRREWLAVDGTGSYACGTVALARTRSYHGILVAALEPPLGRVLVCGGLDEEVTTATGRATPLGTQAWSSGAVAPRGFESVEEMRLEGTLPVWRIALDDGVVVERRLWMPAGAAATLLEYRAIAAVGGPIRLRLSPLLAWRDHHGRMRAGEVPRLEATGSLLRAEWRGGGVALVAASRGEVAGGGDWWLGFRLDAEAERGLDAVEDLYRAGAVRASLETGDALVVAVAVEGAGAGAGDLVALVTAAALEGTAGAAGAGAGAAAPGPARGAEVARQAALLDAGARHDDPSWVRSLVLAADAFVVARGEGATVIAGYPWFGDWGRDTFVALPGLALETGRAALSETLLRTFAAHLDHGLIPNRFPDSGAAPEYNTVDATLWFVEALRRHVETTGDETLVDELWPVLEEIVRWHVEGTRHGIGVDPADGLLRAGEPGVALTWMDARVDGRVVTPRTGKPVEVNALWHNALRTLAGLAATRATRHDHAAMARRVRAGFDRYWEAGRGILRDVVDGPDGDDASLRPNQVLAVSLHHAAVDGDRARAVVDACVRRLLTSVGVRTLDPDDPAYIGRYSGDLRCRDGAYHQGTAWPWLLGPLAAAHLRVHDDRAAARALLAALEHHLGEAGLGSVSEIADGDAPHRPRGCPWQAWSVAEVLRAWRLCRDPAS